MIKPDYNELLYKKLHQEHEAFIADLKTKTPEQIIEASYEKVIKDDLLSIFEYTDFSQTEAKALYKLDKPLDALYQEWLHNDMSYMDMPRDTVDNRIESAVRELKAKSRDSR